jgi:hypothetical protein
MQEGRKEGDLVRHDGYFAVVPNIQAIAIYWYFSPKCPGLIWHRDPPSKKVTLKNDLLLVFQKRRLRLDTNIASVNMTTRSTVKKTVVFDDDLILVLTKQTHTVKVITVRLTVGVGLFF